MSEHAQLTIALKGDAHAQIGAFGRNGLLAERIALSTDVRQAVSHMEVTLRLYVDDDAPITIEGWLEPDGDPSRAALAALLDHPITAPVPIRMTWQAGQTRGLYLDGQVCAAATQVEAVADATEDTMRLRIAADLPNGIRTIPIVITGALWSCPE